MADEKEDKKAKRQAVKEAKRARKKEKKEENGEEEEETLGGKVLIGVVAVFIVLLWLLILGLLVKMDVGGFGSTVLYPVLKDVPVINKILPDVQEYAKEDEAYAYDSVEDAVKRIKELEKELADVKASKDDSDAHVADLEAQSQELQNYKENEAAFEEEKEKFYNEVVFSDQAPDIEQYKEYYESIDPDNAELLYKQVVEQQQTDSKISDYVKGYSQMKPKEAAAIFDTMTDNLNLVAQILENMDAQSRADILGKMNSDTAAKVTEIMNPSE